MRVLSLYIIIFILFFTSCAVIAPIAVFGVATGGVLEGISHAHNKYTEDTNKNKEIKLHPEIILININNNISNEFKNGVYINFYNKNYNTITSKCSDNTCVNNLIHNNNIKYVLMIENISIEGVLSRIKGRFIDLEINKRTNLNYETFTRDKFQQGKEFSNYILDYGKK